MAQKKSIADMLSASVSYAEKSDESASIKAMTGISEEKEEPKQVEPVFKPNPVEVPKVEPAPVVVPKTEPVVVPVVETPPAPLVVPQTKPNISEIEIVEQTIKIYSAYTKMPTSMKTNILNMLNLSSNETEARIVYEMIHNKAWSVDTQVLDNITNAKNMPSEDRIFYLFSLTDGQLVDFANSVVSLSNKSIPDFNTVGKVDYVRKLNTLISTFDLQIIEDIRNIAKELN